MKQTKANMLERYRDTYLQGQRLSLVARKANTEHIGNLLNVTALPPAFSSLLL